MITAGPIVSAEAARGLLGRCGALSLHQRGAFIGPVRFLKRTRGQKTPCRRDSTAGPELPGGRGTVWEEIRGQAGASPPTRSGSPRLLNCVHFDVSPLRIFGKDVWYRITWRAFMIRHKWSPQYAPGFVSA